MSHPLSWHYGSEWLRGLPAPVKNRFFYGMLLTDGVFRTEQRYGDGKRWLVNRLSLGQGVLSGLDFKVTRDAVGPSASDPERWRVHFAPGVAVDGYGREIVVPNNAAESVREVAIVADGETTPASAVKEFLAKLKLGETTTAMLLLQIAYDCTPTDPAPVKAGSCSHDCEPSKTREEFRLRVTKIDKDPRPSSVDPEFWSSAENQEANRKAGAWDPAANLPGVFPQEPAEDVLHRGQAQAYAPADKLHPLVSPAVPESDPDWVALGLINLTVDTTADPPTLTFERIDRYYRQLFSNDALSRLMFALTDRVDEAARVRVLTFNEREGKSGNGQTANVYQPLDKPLVLKLIDSHDAEVKKDWSSVNVLFEVQTPDGGSLSKDTFDKRKPYDPSVGTNYVKVEVEAGGTTKPVFWRLSGTPGHHTVSARVVPAKPDDPPFHPGSQIALHATARATAPTIIGLEFDDLWWHDEKCRKYEWTSKGELDFQLFFSRKLDGTDKLPDLFQVWALYRFHDHGAVVAPKKLAFKPGSLTTDAVCPASTGDEKEVVWRVRGTLSGLFPHLCAGDTLRLVVLGHVPSGAALKSVSSTNLPTPQVLDATFDGSFLSPDFRKLLWDGQPFFDDSKGDEKVVKDTQPTPQPGSDRPTPPHLDHEQRKTVGRYWDRFRPRECCLPTGDGTEGGVFHKTFEFRLPCPC